MFKVRDSLTISKNGTLPRVPFLATKNKILGAKYELSIAFVAPSVAKKLNIKHRHKSYTPNTLSFELSQNSGEIVLCESALRKECKKFAMSYEKYLTFILIHSMLHLKGFSHGGTMEHKEQKLLTYFTNGNKTKHNRRH